MIPDEESEIKAWISVLQYYTSKEKSLTNYLSHVEANDEGWLVPILAAK